MGPSILQDNPGLGVGVEARKKERRGAVSAPETIGGEYMGSGTQGKYTLLNFATLLIALFVLLGLTEITVRVVLSKANRVTLHFHYNLRPDGSPLSTNVNAFRKIPATQPKSENTYRIVVLGDSYTWGDKIADYNDLWTTVLERSLQHELSDKNIEVVNLGIKGFTTVNELELLAGLGINLNPDLVIVQFTLNDPLPSGRNFMHQSEEWLVEQSPRLITNKFLHNVLLKSHLYRLLNGRYQGFKYKATGYTYYDPLYEINFPGWVACQKALISISNMCEKNRIKAVMLIYPRFYNDWLDEEEYMYRHLHTKIAVAGRNAGMAVFDLVPVFASESPNMKGLMALEGYNPHPNEKANRIAGQAFGRFIKGNKLVGNNQ